MAQSPTASKASLQISESNIFESESYHYEDEVEDEEEEEQEQEEEVDPFITIPLKDRLKKKYNTLKRFFKSHKYRVEVFKSIGPSILAYYVEPESTERIAFNIMMVVTVLWNLISVPYRACMETYTHVGFRVVDVVTDVIAYVNIIMLLLQAVQKHGELIKKRTTSLKACFSIWFFIEVISYIPVDYGVRSPWARINRMLGIFYYDQYFSTIENMAARISFLNANPVVLRIFKLVAYFLFTIHWFSCLFIFNATRNHNHGNYLLPGGGPGVDVLMGDVFVPPVPDSDYNFQIRFRQYMGGLVFSTLYLVGYGYTVPQNETDVIYALGTVIGGTALFATIVGTAVALLDQLGATEQAFAQKMQNIKDYMRFRNVSEKLQKDTLSFFSIVQRSGRGLDQEEIMGDLEVSIKRNIAQYLHRSIVGQVPLFQQCGELFIQDICQYLNYTLLLKDYRIVNKGEIGKEMFFIGKGSVEVISEDGSIVFAKLEAGKFFGEIALLSADARRTASIRAAELCEVYVLTKHDFDNVISRYPDAKRILQEEIDRRNLANSTMKAAPKEDKKVKKSSSRASLNTSRAGRGEESSSKASSSSDPSSSSRTPIKIDLNAIHKRIEPPSNKRFGFKAMTGISRPSSRMTATRDKDNEE